MGGRAGRQAGRGRPLEVRESMPSPPTCSAHQDGVGTGLALCSPPWGPQRLPSPVVGVTATPLSHPAYLAAVNLMLEGGLEIGEGSDDPAAAVAPGATALYRYTVPARCPSVGFRGLGFGV